MLRVRKQPIIALYFESENELNVVVDFLFLLLPLWESVIVLCFVVRYFMSILVLQSSWWGRESWLLCLICLPGVLWWLSGSSSRCYRVVCSLWLWYFLIILIYYFLWPRCLISSTGMFSFMFEPSSSCHLYMWEKQLYKGQGVPEPSLYPYAISTIIT